MTHRILLLDFITEQNVADLSQEFPDCTFIDARDSEIRDQNLGSATIVYGKPPIKRLSEAKNLQWIQLLSAGVPRSLCEPARNRNIVVTNLAGLYGASIAEHTLTLMSMLSRNLHLAMRNQLKRKWDNRINRTMFDLAGKTVAIVGAGNIGQEIGRLAKAFGMRVVGCRRNFKPTPFVDRLYPMEEMHSMLAEGDFVVVALPLTIYTEGILGEKEFTSMKDGVFYINISRGAVAKESALLAALQSGKVAGAGLDVFAKEPLPEDSPFWELEQVIISPHYSGDPVNFSVLPLQRFRGNLQAWLSGKPLQNVVDLNVGY